MVERLIYTFFLIYIIMCLSNSKWRLDTQYFVVTSFTTVACSKTSVGPIAQVYSMMHVDRIDVIASYFHLNMICINIIDAFTTD